MGRRAKYNVSLGSLRTMLNPAAFRGSDDLRHRRGRPPRDRSIWCAESARREAPPSRRALLEEWPRPDVRVPARWDLNRARRSGSAWEGRRKVTNAGDRNGNNISPGNG